MAVITPEGTPSPAERADDTPANNVRPSTESEVLPKPARLTITFRDMQGNEQVFKLKSTTKMEKVMAAYCAQVQREKRCLRFLAHGVRVLDDMTPQDLELLDGDEVDVGEEMIGGGGELGHMWL